MPEIELKLRGSSVRLKAAFAHLEQSAVEGSSFRKNLRAIYFDTAKEDLHAKGISFRVRDEDGRFIQTLKLSAADGDALTRGEWSDDVAAAAPQLLNTESGRRLKRVWKDVRLLPRFCTQITRHGCRVRPRRGIEVEVVRDEGEIQSVGHAGDVVRISEIELELKRGSPGALYEIALRILALAPVQIEPRAKSDRGYALLSPGAGSAPVKADAPAIDGRATLAEVLRSAARRHFGQFLANLANAVNHDPASIHQMRVAMRRLRSALYAVRDLVPVAEYDFVRTRLRYLLRSLGEARDWQVLTERLAEIEDDDVESDAGDLQRFASTRKRRALVRAVDAVGSRKNTRTLLEAMLWFENLPTARHGLKLKTKARDAAKGLLDELFGRVRRRGRHFAEQSVGDRHRLRIACKNLRYNIELFSSLYGKRKVDRFLTQLKPVQDDLGHLNDVSRARDLLGELAKRSPQRAAADAVVLRLEARVAAVDKNARKRLASLRSVRPFW